jgi:hypothetical protein
MWHEVFTGAAGTRRQRPIPDAKAGEAATIKTCLLLVTSLEMANSPCSELNVLQFPTETGEPRSMKNRFVIHVYQIPSLLVCVGLSWIYLHALVVMSMIFPAINLVQ